MSHVLHVLDRLSGAGPTRAMIALVRALGRRAEGFTHRAIALEGGAYPMARIQAKRAGVTVMLQPDADQLRDEIEQADIVQLYYWNNPTIGELLRGELPAMRLLLWSMILGRHAPQVLTAPVLRYADVAVVSSPATLDLPAVREVARGLRQPAIHVVPVIADVERLADLRPRPHPNFNVGYIGTVNFSKMHPRFVPMSAAVDVPEIRFIVCGEGDSEALRAQAAALDAADRFEWRGFVENIKPVLESLDVFGYPLCEETFAASEGSLQEAMLAQVPPVVFPHGGLKHLVEHGRTGLVVRSETEYAAAIEYLHRHPEVRRRLGRNARAFALKAFDADRTAHRFLAIYGQMMAGPKRRRCWEGVTSDRALEFVEAMGDAAPEFALSMTAKRPEQWRAPDRRIAEAPTILASGEGGIIHYRNRYPDAPYLRLWAGLVLCRSGRHLQAAQEFEAAVQAGLDPERVADYLKASEREEEL